MTVRARLFYARREFCGLHRQQGGGGGRARQVAPLGRRDAESPRRATRADVDACADSCARCAAARGACSPRRADVGDREERARSRVGRVRAKVRWDVSSSEARSGSCRARRYKLLRSPGGAARPALSRRIPMRLRAVVLAEIERRRMMFSCCHPALAEAARTALIAARVRLKDDEVALAFFSRPSAMESASWRPREGVYNGRGTPLRYDPCRARESERRRGHASRRLDVRRRLPAAQIAAENRAPSASPSRPSRGAPRRLARGSRTAAHALAALTTSTQGAGSLGECRPMRSCRTETARRGTAISSNSEWRTSASASGSDSPSFHLGGDRSAARPRRRQIGAAD